MSVKEVVDLGAKKINEPHVLAALKDSHFEAIDKSDKYTEQEKVEINSARFKSLNEAIASADKTKIADVLKRMNQKQIEKLDSATLQKEAFVAALTSGQYLELMKATNSLSQETRDAIKDARLKPLNTAIAANNQAEVNRAIMGFKASEIIKLPANILTNPLVMFNFDKDILSTMIKEGTQVSTRDQVRAYFDQIQRTAGGVSPIDKIKDWLNSKAGAVF